MFHDGYSEVKKNDKYNFINTNGQIISPNLWFDDAYGFQDGYAKVEKDAKWYFIDTNGRLEES